MEGWPELELESERPTSVVADFGESLEEAEGLVLGLTPLPTVSVAIPAGRHRSRATTLAETLRRRFWRPRVGMIHTLNHVGLVPNPHLPAVDHAERTYTQGIALGESGPSRQANALAILAGALQPEDLARALAVLDDPDLPPIITPYFQWFIAEAQAKV